MPPGMHFHRALKKKLQHVAKDFLEYRCQEARGSLQGKAWYGYCLSHRAEEDALSAACQHRIMFVAAATKLGGAESWRVKVYPAENFSHDEFPAQKWCPILPLH